MATPKLKTVPISHLYIDGDTPAEACDRIKNAEQEALGKGFTNFTVRHVEDEYEDYYHIMLYGDRMETKSEAISREAREAETAARQEEYQRRQFEALKKKFGE